MDSSVAHVELNSSQDPSVVHVEINSSQEPLPYELYIAKITKEAKRRSFITAINVFIVVLMFSLAIYSADKTHKINHEPCKYLKSYIVNQVEYLGTFPQVNITLGFVGNGDQLQFNFSCDVLSRCMSNTSVPRSVIRLAEAVYKLSDISDTVVKLWVIDGKLSTGPSTDTSEVYLIFNIDMGIMMFFANVAIIYYINSIKFISKLSKKYSRIVNNNYLRTVEHRGYCFNLESTAWNEHMLFTFWTSCGVCVFVIGVCWILLSNYASETCEDSK